MHIYIYIYICMYIYAHNESRNLRGFFPHLLKKTTSPTLRQQNPIYPSCRIFFFVFSIRYFQQNGVTFWMTCAG